MAPAKAPATLDAIVELMRHNEESARKRFDDLRTNFEEKHSENKSARHALRGELQQQKDEIYLVKGRLGVLEDRLHHIVGDNTGSGGLLNKIDRAVQEVKEEIATLNRRVSSIEQTVKGTPQMQRFMWICSGVILFLSFAVPIIVSILIEYLKLQHGK